jgi:hypothetical protein
MITVTRSFKPQSLKSARDLRKLRAQLREAAADWQGTARAQFELVGACTAVARTLLHQQGEGQFCVEVVVEGAREGLRVTFNEYLADTAEIDPGPLMQSLLAGLPQRGFADIAQFVDQVDASQPGRAQVAMSLLKWLK